MNDRDLVKQADRRIAEKLKKRQELVQQLELKRSELEAEVIRLLVMKRQQTESNAQLDSQYTVLKKEYLDGVK